MTWLEGMSTENPFCFPADNKTYNKVDKALLRKVKFTKYFLQHK